MVVESPVPQEQPLAGPTESPNKLQYVEGPTSTSEIAPMATTSETTVNGVDSGNDGQRSQPPQNAVNGIMPMYPFPPPGSVYPVGAGPDMYQGIPGGPGSRMMAPVPYPFPPVQHGQPGHPGPYPFPAVMTQPTAGGTSPTSPTAGQMQMPYPPYAMWYGPPGMGVPPPVSLPQNGIAPVPIPVGPYPPQAPHMYQPPHQGEVPPVENTQQQHHQQQSNGTQQSNGAPWVPGPGGLPPKEVARTIPCRYFPECRFGASCWFLHPGVDQSQTHGNDDTQQPKPFLSGSMPPPVRYGPSGAWDPSGAATQASGVSPISPDSAKPPYSPQGNVPNGNYGMLYAPYPYPPVNGYPPVYPGQQQHSAPASSAPTSAPPQSPQQTSQTMSPQHGAQSVQQHPPSQTHSPVAPTPPGAPTMYPVNGHPIGYYPPPFPYPQPPPSQAPSTTPGTSATPGLYSPTASHQLSPVNSNVSPAMPNGAPDASISPTSPSLGQTGGPIPQIHMAPLPQAAHGGPIPVQAMPHGIPYPIPGPYSSVPPPHSRSPSQSMHPHSPQNPPIPPQALYGQSPPQQPAPILPHGRHSRRESMSSIAAVPMGTLLGPNLDGNGAIDDSRNHPSAFRDMENGFGSNRRGRGHASRGSWSSNGFGSGRKPPCAFYPVGKCKNGDQCRFPHIMPDENSPASPVSPRGGHGGPFGRMANGRRPTILGPIEDKLADMTVKENDGQEPLDNGPRSAGPQKPSNSSPKFRNGRTSISTPSTPGHRQPNNGQTQAQQSTQRLPSAADFPTLGGMTASSSSANGQGAWSGQTAAQVLKSGIAKKSAAPASPAMKESKIDGEILTDDSLHVSPGASIVVEGTA